MFKYILSLVFLFNISTNLLAQELRCKVSISTSNITESDKSKFIALETQITEFLNNTKFTNHVFEEEEKINCNFNITLDKDLGNGNYSVNLFVSSSRPIYKTAYKSPLFKAVDKKVVLEILETTRLEYTEDFYQNNISSILCFYANVILGYDYNSFSLNGGKDFIERANEIARNAQSSNQESEHWSSSKTNSNRFWLATQANTKKYKLLTNFIYTLHIKILDILHDQPEVAKELFVEEIKKLEGLKYIGGDFYPKTFFETKAEEIFFLAESIDEDDKPEVIKILQSINPINNSKYWNRLEKGNTSKGKSLKNFLPQQSDENPGNFNSPNLISTPRTSQTINSQREN